MEGSIQEGDHEERKRLKRQHHENPESRNKWGITECCQCDRRNYKCMRCECVRLGRGCNEFCGVCNGADCWERNEGNQQRQHNNLSQTRQKNDVRSRKDQQKREVGKRGRSKSSKRNQPELENEALNRFIESLRQESQPVKHTIAADGNCFFQMFLLIF